jgi:phenylalanyl-tRNA synthetase beta chain
MKISRNWLQTYFADPLPDATALAGALTFHVFEIDGIEAIKMIDDFASEPKDWILDVKVTANRGHDCLSYRGIAKEISAILNVPMINDPLSSKLNLTQIPHEDLSVSIQDPALCNRFTAAYITGLKVGPSPQWLREWLEAMGQRSINNVVDITNYVMFDIGQPLHAFDAAKLVKAGALQTYALNIRAAREGENMIGLDDKQYALHPSMLVIADVNNGDIPVSIAGIKGGKPTGIDETTTDIILEAANWNGATIRKTSQALKLRTDASARFEQVISAELAAYGLQAAITLITDPEIAGGTVVGYTDEYPIPAQQASVSISTSRINAVLGSALKDADVVDALRRLGLSSIQEGESFTVHVPFERLDITIPEDLIEEVGRIIGYDKIPNTELAPLANPPQINANFYAAEKAREELISQGYSEVFTSVFADKGERVIANKIDGVRPYLRTNLSDGLIEAMKRNLPNKELLGLPIIKLFEVGTIWENGKEEIHVATLEGSEWSKDQKVNKWHGTEKVLEPVDATTYEQFTLSSAVRYASFSRYPSIVRDIALWTPIGTAADDVLQLIKQSSGPLLMRIEKFDEFAKGERVSYAFRLVFQSFEKTLTDVEINAVMQEVAAALKVKGYEIR